MILLLCSVFHVVNSRCSTLNAIFEYIASEFSITEWMKCNIFRETDGLGQYEVRYGQMNIRPV